MSKIQNNTEKPKNILINGKTVWRRLGRSKEITWRIERTNLLYSEGLGPNLSYTTLLDISRSKSLKYL